MLAEKLFKKKFCEKHAVNCDAMNTDQLWTTCLGELEVLLSKASFTTWFKQTHIIRIDNDLVLISTPNSFAREWLQKKFNNEILETLNKHVDGIQKIEYVINSQKEASSKEIVQNTVKEIDNIKQKEEPEQEALLNPRYNFENFVIGESNRLAHAASLAIVKNPGVTYNPLFIYGGVGLGKTHLMQAIGNEIKKRDKKKNVIYTTCEKFSNEFISLIRKGKGEEFKKNYRTADVLLIDDIQFLVNKERTQEEFFHTFNELHDKFKQIVMTSDRAPKQISGLEDRLVSRFEWGMLADINTPDIETRIAILQNKVAEKGFHTSEEVIQYVAKNIQNNIRELEGALNRIIAYSELNNKYLELEDVKIILGSKSVKEKQKNISPKDVLKRVAEFYNISMDEILGVKRNKELVFPRQVFAYILREELCFSFPRIGKELGGKDHTTIMHSCTKIGQEIKANDTVRHELNSIKDKMYS